MGAGGYGAFRTQAEALKFGYYAPPPGAATGVADYAETLRAALPPEPAVDLYHLGNNGLHADIYDRALRTPGVIVLHDAVLHHFLLGHLTREQYVGEFVYNYGEWRRHFAESLWEERGASGSDARYFEFPLLRRAVESAKSVIVHNAAAARMARAHGAKNVHTIPHFFAPQGAWDRADAIAFRQDRAIPQTHTLFGIFGYLRETKRILACIGAFRRLHALQPETALLIAGKTASPDLARLIAGECEHPAIHRAWFLDERDFETAAIAIDACLNLRYPGAGETSGVAIRMAGAGCPVIVTDGEEYADWPVTACLRVRPGIAEAEELFDHMVVVSRFPQTARAIGREARRHLIGNHSLEKAAAMYREILCAAA